MIKQCTVVVYGDLGRSPRMQNHVKELLELNYQVNYLGYLDNPLRPSIAANPNLTVFNLNLRLVNMLRRLPRQLYLVYALLRVLLESLYLFFILMVRLSRQEFIMVQVSDPKREQNPPSIPVMAICYFVRVLRRSLFVVDFHNYGHTILALQIRNQFILNLAYKYEVYFGRKADYSFCVSEAMRNDLVLNWNVGGRYKNLPYPVVLYDKADTARFKVFGVRERHELLQRLGLKWGDQMSNETIATYEKGGKYYLREDRPVMLISATSWTKDEDFGLLLAAMEAYEIYAGTVKERLPRIYVAITGKGPEKQTYQRIIEERSPHWRQIMIQLLWLEVDDYPKLLASCDLGVCLHYSSSGLDLPMKVVDMFGAGIPVLAKRFKAIPELVEEHQNGILFDSHQDLFEYILLLVKGFPGNTVQLDQMREQVKEFRKTSFHEEWIAKVGPFLKPKRD